MGYLLLNQIKPILTSDIMSGNPSKKIRLDSQTKHDDSVGNEDLWGWGHDDLTAEEFDLLEIQATQACNQNITYNDPPHHNTTYNQQSNFDNVEDLKQLQYELEGRVKLLSQSLEKSLKELNEERLNRDRLVKERTKELNERESNLQKEIETMRSILEFKDQEMKSSFNKMQMMKSQFQDRKNCTSEATVNNQFEDFLNSSKKISCDHSRKCIFAKMPHRKHKLITDTPNGETKGVDILSSVLFTRLSFSIPNHESEINNIFFKHFSSNFNFTSACVVKLKNGEKSDELLEYYNFFLRNHVALLRSRASKSNTTSCNKNLPISSNYKEAGYSCSVVSYLKDLVFIFSCPSINHFIERDCSSFGYPIGDTKILRVEESPLCAPFLCEGNMNQPVSILSQIMESLSALANPKTYPSGYVIDEEIEYSLSALLAVCLSNPQMFLDLIGELPMHALLNPLQNITAVCITLKLLIVLCCCQNFVSFLAHKHSNCTICLIAALLINIIPHYPEQFAIAVTLVEDLLSLVFSTFIFPKTLFETSDCFSEVVKGIILTVWKYYQMREKVSLSIAVIKKGFLLLHNMSCNIPNFKERRNPVENEYISLISSVLAFSKENIELREFYDLAHSLWDFQSDVTEFDLDDFSEETQTSTTDMELNK